MHRLFGGLHYGGRRRNTSPTLCPVVERIRGFAPCRIAAGAIMMCEATMRRSSQEMRNGARGAWTIMALALIATAARAQDTVFSAPVLDVRPRIFLRADEAFEGLTVAKLRKAAASPEFASVRAKWSRKPLGRALLWMIDGEQDDLRAAVDGLRKMKVQGGSWSGRGLALMRLATLYDWLSDELDEPVRREVEARIEAAADAAVEHIQRGRAPFFYSRTPGALAGMTLAGIALHGVSDKAEGYLALLREWGVEDYFKAYAWVNCLPVVFGTGPIFPESTAGVLANVSWSASRALSNHKP